MPTASAGPLKRSGKSCQQEARPVKTAAIVTPIAIDTEKRHPVAVVPDDLGRREYEPSGGESNEHKLSDCARAHVALRHRDMEQGEHEGADAQQGKHVRHDGRDRRWRHFRKTMP